MKVRAKFVCQAVTAFITHKQASFSAIYGKEGENADFTKVTPWGELKMNIDNDAPASQAFEPGKSYYLTFESAE
jgi:hypothetical protein